MLIFVYYYKYNCEKVKNMSDQICESSIDFSAVRGDRILPFIFYLNKENSNLDPAPGEYQTFCYDVIGVDVAIGETIIQCGEITEAGCDCGQQAADCNCISGRTTGKRD